MSGDSNTSRTLTAFERIKAKGFGPPPKPEEVPPLVGVPADLTAPADTGMEALAGDAPERARLNEAAAGALPAANDIKRKPRMKRVALVADKTERRERLPEGYKQLNGGVPADVHLRVMIATKVHGKTVGEIVAEAFALWEKKNDPNR